MTVSSTTTKNSYAGDGSNAVFAYTFKVFDEDDLTVILRTDATGTETVQTITTNYTVSGVGDAGGGNVTFVTAPASGVTVVIRRSAAITQTADYTPNDPFPAEEHENALDKLTFIAQQQQEELDRAIKLSRTNTMTSTEFTVGSTDRANKILAFDGTGELSVTQELGVFRGDWTADTAFAVRDLIKDTTNDNIYICQTAHTSSGSLPISTNTDSSKWELIVDAATATSSATAAAASAAAAATSETNAATSETNAATSETNAAASEAGVAADASAAAASAAAASASETAAAASETAAAASETAAAASETAAASSASSASTSASTATTKAAEAATSATNAATSETNAASSASAASTSATNAATSETNAASSASAASTSASNAATSETNAATSATNAATSETNAATSETNAAASATSASSSASTATTKAAEAATSASNAATSETNAATSETNAATSASNAASSATSAASSASSASSAQTAAESARDATLAAYDNFDDRYLGAKSSAPTVDNDGNALVAGSLYFDTVDEVMYVYTGSAWVAAYVSGTGFLALSGGTMTGTITFDAAQTFDGRDVSADGAKLDGIEAGATADQTKADIDALGINAATLDSIDSTQFLRSDAADTKTAGDLSFDNNVKATFGGGSELTIWSNGSNSLIQEAGTGSLFIDASDLQLRNTGGTEIYFMGTSGGSTQLRHANSQKLATTSSGIDVTGTVTADGLTVDNGTTTGVTIEGDSWARLQFIKSSATANTSGLINDSNGFSVYDWTAGGRRLTAANNGDISFYDSTGTTQGFFWDASTQRLGLGVTAPAAPVDIAITSNQGLLIDATAGNNAYLSITNGGSNTGAKIGFDNALNAAVIGHHTHGNILYANSSGNVGIGTSPSTVLHLNDTTDPIIRLQRGGGVYSQVQSDGAGSLYLSADAANTTASSRMQFNVDGSEAARISGGNFLVGTSNEAPASNNVAGVALKNGSSHFSADGGEALRINRKTSDGQLISLRKDASEVGGIGTNSSRTYIGSGSGQSGIKFNTNAIVPVAGADGANSDNTYDLGVSSARFKDAYLSSYVYASGIAGISDGNTYIRLAGSDVMQFFTGGSERARLDSSGNLLVSKTTTSGAFNTVGIELRATGLVQSTVDSAKPLDLNRKTTTGEIIGFNYNGTAEGSVTVTASGVTYNTTSDLRLKENIEPLVATDKLMAMNPVSYNWKADPDGPRSMGFIAQEMQEVMPEAVAVGDDEDAMMSMDYGRITPILVSALQDAHRKIEQLEQRLADMEAK